LVICNGDLSSIHRNENGIFQRLQAGCSWSCPRTGRFHMRNVRSICFIVALTCVIPSIAAAQYAPSGQPLVGNGSGPQTSAQYQDAHIHDSGNDMSQAIDATWGDCAPSVGVAGAVSCAIKAGYPGYQVWSVNPFTSNLKNGGDVDLCSSSVTDIRVGGPSVAGVFPQFVLPSRLHLHGCGNSSSVQGNNNYANTIIRACNPRETLNKPVSLS
jgi:hypothetical protein